MRIQDVLDRARAAADGVIGWWNARPIVWDGILAGLMALTVVPATLDVTTGDWPLPLIATWALLFVVPLVWRRTRPDVATAGVALACLLNLFLAPTLSPGVLAVPLVVHAQASHGQPRRARWWFLLALIGAGLAGLVFGWVSRDSPFLTRSPTERLVNATAIAIFSALVASVAWFLGRFQRQRRLTVETLRQRAADLERERDQNVRIATQAERTRIAREMHDIVAHSLSLIVVQADGGAYLANHEEAGDAASRLAASGAALDTIADTARRALAETRHLVGVLRSDTDRAPDLTPTQGLDDVPELVREVGTTMPVSLSLVGDPTCHPPLPQGAQLACYRVVQEALTNVLKHAGPAARATVTLTHSPSAVSILVADDGRGSMPSDGAGRGLVGMRERVTAWGGTVEARDRIDGGFQVHAVIPTHQD